MVMWLLGASAVLTGYRVAWADLLKALLGSDDEPDQDAMKMYLQEVAGAVPIVGSGLSMLEYGSAPVPLIDTAARASRNLYELSRFGPSPDRVIKTLGAVGRVAGVPGAGQAEQIARKAIREPQGFQRVPQARRL
jgi:hypothetical protein